MKEIKLRIMGGLGNQLYQYAAARYIQEKIDADSILIDIAGYEKYKIRNLELNSILRNDAVKFRKLSKKKYSIVREFFHVYQRLYRSGMKKHAPMSKINIGHTSYLLSSVEFNDNLVDDLQDDIYMYGYFVSAKIAQNMRNQLMKEIIEPDNLSNEYREMLLNIQATNAVGISIRCGEDYKVNGWPICTKEYYISGMDRIRAIHPDAIFYIFADEIDRVKREEWFKEFSVQYMENISICESFELLRNCKHYVCSNSSFSWWGAFLSYADNPIRINPNKIYPGNSRDVDETTFYERLTYLDFNTGEAIS